MKNNIFRSAIFQMTAYYVIILMTISLIFSTVIYTVSIRELNHAFEALQIRKSNDNFELMFDDNPRPIIRLKGRLEKINQINNILLFDLVVFNLSILGLGTVASYFLAKKTLDPIDKAYQSQIQFTSDAAHELRTPLTAIRMDTEVGLLDKKITKNQMREILEDNLKTVDDMDKIISQLLLLASEEKVELDKISLKNSVQEAVAKMTDNAKNRNIEIIDKISNKSVKFNHDYLVNLLVIFIDNAIKYSPNKSKIKISNKVLGNKIKIMIADQGIGIAKDDSEKVFDRFYRADKSRNKCINGCGIGLSIAKKISDQYSLKLKLEPNKNKGTIVSFVLPLEK